MWKFWPTKTVLLNQTKPSWQVWECKGQVEGSHHQLLGQQLLLSKSKVRRAGARFTWSAPPSPSWTDGQTGVGGNPRTGTDSSVLDWSTMCSLAQCGSDFEDKLWSTEFRDMSQPQNNVNCSWSWSGLWWKWWISKANVMIIKWDWSTKEILGELLKHEMLHLTFSPKLESRLLNRGVWLVREGVGGGEMRGIHYLRFRLSHAGPSLPISQTHLSIFNRHSDSAKFVFLGSYEYFCIVKLLHCIIKMKK